MATRDMDTIVREWVQRAPTSDPLYETGRTVSANGRTLEGRWTAGLAEYLPAGRLRARPTFLVTGDRWTSPGWGHANPQDTVRRYVETFARENGADVLLVPFSALAGANVDVSSIRPLDIRPDRRWTEYEPVPAGVGDPATARRRPEPAPRPRYGNRAPAPRGETVSHYSPAPVRFELEWIGADGHTYRQTETVTTWTRYAVAGPENRYSSRPAPIWRETTLETPEYGTLWRIAGRGQWNYHQCEPDPDNPGAMRTTIQQHRLGDSLFLADVATSETRSRPVSVRDVVAGAVMAIRGERMDREYGRDVTPASVRFERFDVDEPITETVQVRRRRRFVSSFDANEPWPGLYFLATLPASSSARTVDMAIQDLAPAAVHAALARGRDVRRQGDIFAIATSLTDDELAGYPRARLSQWTSGARAKPGEYGYRPRPTSADRKRALAWRRREWRRRFRALNARALETRPKTETRGHVPADADEYDRRAIRGRRRRHGAPRYRTRDNYRKGYGTNALALWRAITAESLERYGFTVRTAENVRERIRDTLSIHGTAHSATEVVRGPGGAVYVRGTMRHVPSLERGRSGARDHVNLKLGDGRTWYLAIRNTVPRQRDTDRRP